MRTLLAAWILVSPAASVGQPVPGEQPAPSVLPKAAAQVASPSRFDIARSYQRLEEACDRHRDGEWDRVQVSDIMDEAAGAFLSGRFGPAITLLDEATRRIGGEALPRAWGLADGRSVRPQHPVTISATPATVVLDVVNINPDLPAGELTLRVRTRSGDVIEQRPVDLSALPTSLEFANLAPGAYIGEWVFEGSPTARPACSFVVAPTSLDAAREELLKRLDAVCAAADTTCDIARARAAFITDSPPGLSFAELRFDPLTRLEELREEVRLIERGHDPYRARLGDTWRTFASRGGPIPMRLYVPQVFFERGPGAGEGAPLVVALHGAGGDENLWMDGYAAGAIQRLADQHGFIVASPLAYSFLGDARMLDDLVTDLSLRYAIDPNRIHVIGHSMGGVGATLLAQHRSETIASACAIAGAASMDPERPSAPLLVFAAERDRIVPAARVRRACRAGLAAGLPIDLRDSPGLGHSLVVAVELAGAIEWLMEHPRREK